MANRLTSTVTFYIIQVFYFKNKRLRVVTSSLSKEKIWKESG